MEKGTRVIWQNKEWTTGTVRKHKVVLLLVKGEDVVVAPLKELIIVKESAVLSSNFTYLTNMPDEQLHLNLELLAKKSRAKFLEYLTLFDTFLDVQTSIKTRDNGEKEVFMTVTVLMNELKKLEDNG